MDVLLASLFALVNILLPVTLLVLGILWVKRVVKRQEERPTAQLELERQHAEQFRVLMSQLDRIEQRLDANPKHQ